MHLDKNIETFCCTAIGKAYDLESEDEDFSRWKQKYKKQLMESGGENLDVYEDMDGSYRSEESDYYGRLVDFLNEREDNLADKLNGSFKYDFGCKRGIVVLCEQKELFVLRSDLFGFSAPRLDWRTTKKCHPYDIYLRKNQEQLDNAIDKVIDWILKSRTLGGAFLWPIRLCADGKYRTEYNNDRGGTIPGCKVYHIQDRVDLTLLEIKHAYDPNYEEKYSGDKLFRYYIDEKEYKEYQPTYMKTWLEHFNSFETYVEFFELGAFIDQKTWMPYNILEANGITVDDIVKNNPRITKESNIEKMCDYLIEKIQERSKNMMNRKNSK